MTQQKKTDQDKLNGATVAGDDKTKETHKKPEDAGKKDQKSAGETGKKQAPKPVK